MHRQAFKIILLLLLTNLSLVHPPGSIIFAQALPTAQPNEVQLSTAKLNVLQGHFNNYVEEGKIPGVAIAIARHGKLAYQSHIGFRDIAGQAPIEDDTIFRIASMSKIITSVAVLKLFEQGKLQLSDPISKYIPALEDMEVLEDPQTYPGPTSPSERKMTIHDLLLHTSGLGMSTGGGVNNEYGRVMANGSLTLEEKMAEIGKLPLLYQPGTQWRYSIATSVLGYLIEVVSGIPFEMYLKEKLFEPLGMTDTGFYVPSEKSDRVISVYRVDESAGLSLARSGLSPVESRPPNAPNGAGGLFSTVNDYLRFSQMLLNGGSLGDVQILSPKTVALMTMDHLPDHISLPAQFGRNYGLAGYGFGLGVRVRTDVAASNLPGSIGEYGWGGVFETYVLIDPKEELIGIYMTQVRPSSFYPLRREFTTLLYSTLKTKDGH